MSLGAIDFGLIVDGAVIIVENCLRRLGEAQHHKGRLLTLQERLHEVMVAAKEMIQPSVYGQAIIVTVYFPILALTGVEGKMFQPMALTVIFALVAAFILSLTFVPAMVAILITGKVTEKDMFLIRWAKAAYEPVLKRAVQFRWPVAGAAVLAFAASALLFTRLGQEFVPTLDEKDLALQALRTHPLAVPRSRLCLFKDWYGGTGFRSDAPQYLRYLRHLQADQTVAERSGTRQAHCPESGGHCRAIRGTGRRKRRRAQAGWSQGQTHQAD
jgi:cobalt-zinc-cadmium resistance protein CzcA